MQWAKDVKERQERPKKGVATAPPELVGNEYVII